MPLSKLIRWGLGQTCSHFIIAFDDAICFHSYMTGCDLEFLDTIKERAEIVYEIPLSLSQEDEELIYQNLVKRFYKKRYDYLALLYFIYRGILYKLFKSPIPTHNAWGRKNSFLCTEVAYCLPYKVLPFKSDLAMTSPDELYKLISESIK